VPRWLLLLGLQRVEVPKLRDGQSPHLEYMHELP
jgi:hypothetical protein